MANIKLDSRCYSTQVSFNLSIYLSFIDMLANGITGSNGSYQILEI